MLSHYIDDGQALESYILERERLYPALSFSHRPILPAERNAAEREALNRNTAMEKLAVLHRVAKDKLIDWNAVDRDGNTLPINEQSFHHLHPMLWDQLIDMLMGYKPSDVKPDATPAERDEYQAARKALADGKVPGDEHVSAVQKN